jgi:hypothetical protein
MIILHVAHQRLCFLIIVQALDNFKHLRGNAYQSGVRPLRVKRGHFAKAIGNQWQTKLTLITPNGVLIQA